MNGKGASRRLRKTGLVPGILYGGVEEAKVIELDHKMLLMEFNKEAFQSSIISLIVDGNKEDVFIAGLPNASLEKTSFTRGFPESICQ